ncbi:MAG: VWA domain-containing protein [Acidobacteriota bacterium]
MMCLKACPSRILSFCFWLIFAGVALDIVEPGKAQTSNPIGQENIRVEVNLATLKFTVKNSDGSLLNELTQEDFQVFEGGAPQQIVFFDPPRNQSGEARPLRLAFMIDVSGSTFATRAEEIAAAITFLDNVHDFTEVGVFGFNDELLPFQDFTANRSLAQRALAQARRPLGQTGLYSSLEELLKHIRNRPATTSRNVIIIISDGMDEAYGRAEQAIEQARLGRVVIYTVLVPSAAQLYIGPRAAEVPAVVRAEPSRDGRSEKEAAFSSLSIRTSGKHFSGFETILNFDDVMAQINDDVFGNLYSIGYYTDDPYRAKAQRNIRVEISHPEAFIPARFEKLPDDLAVKREFIEALFDSDAIAGLIDNLYSFREIGADLDVLSVRREGRQMGLPFRIKISPHPLRGEGGDVRTQFGVIGLLLDRQGNEVVRLREIFRVDLDDKDIRNGRGIIYTNTLFAPPGDYILKIALLEIATWKLTSFSRLARIRQK